MEADLTKSTFHTSPPPGDPSQHNASSLLLLNGKEASLANRLSSGTVRSGRSDTPMTGSRGSAASGSNRKGGRTMEYRGFLFTKIEFRDFDIVVPFLCTCCGWCCEHYLPRFTEREVLRIAVDAHLQCDDTLRQYLEGYEKRRHGRDVSCIFLLGKRSLRDPRPPPEARGLPPLPLLLP